mgnify:CR=1 FL=1
MTDYLPTAPRSICSAGCSCHSSYGSPTHKRCVSCACPMNCAKGREEGKCEVGDYCPRCCAASYHNVFVCPVCNRDYSMSCDGRCEMEERNLCEGHSERCKECSTCKVCDNPLYKVGYSRWSVEPICAVCEPKPVMIKCPGPKGRYCKWGSIISKDDSVCWNCR